MAGADLGGGGSHGKSKHQKKHKKRRAGVRIDMTPLVDVAFLLLTFFMLTTVMRRQETMEINLPPNNKTQIDIAESNLMTMFVAQNDSVFYSMGTDKPQSIAYDKLENFFQEKAQQNTKLVILLKFDRKSRYHMMVNVIDKLNLAKLQRFSIAPMTDNDTKLLAKASS
jgi:biopolymer transport protein ExbD